MKFDVQAGTPFREPLPRYAVTYAQTTKKLNGCCSSSAAFNQLHLPAYCLRENNL